MVLFLIEPSDLFCFWNVNLRGDASAFSIVSSRAMFVEKFPIKLGGVKPFSRFLEILFNDSRLASFCLDKFIELVPSSDYNNSASCFSFFISNSALHSLIKSSIYIQSLYKSNLNLVAVI